MAEFDATQFVAAKFAERGDGGGSLSYEDFMSLLLDLDEHLPAEHRIYLADMSKARLSAMFYIFDTRPASPTHSPTINQEAVVRFVEEAAVGAGIDHKDAADGENVLHADYDKTGVAGLAEAGASPDAQEQDAEASEASSPELERGLRAIGKATGWIARHERKSIGEVLRGVFEPRDGDETGFVTVGQFAAAMNKVGAEITRPTMGAVLQALGVDPDSQPRDRCVNYLKLVKLVEGT